MAHNQNTSDLKTP